MTLNILKTGVPPHEYEADKVISDVIDAVKALEAGGGSATIDPGAVGTIELADGAVTSAKLDTNIAVAGTFGVPNAKTTLYDLLSTGGIRVNSPVTKALAAGSQNDVDFGAGMLHANVLNLNGNVGNSVVTGMWPYQGNGEIYFAVNKGAGTVTLKHNDAGSTAGNRFMLAGAVDRVLAVNEGCLMFHDGSAWYLV